MDIETVLPCEGEDTATMLGLTELLDRFSLEPFEPVDYRDIPAPDYTFESMPGDPLTEAPLPAIDVPMAIDLDDFNAPPRSG